MRTLLLSSLTAALLAGCGGGSASSPAPVAPMPTPPVQIGAQVVKSGSARNMSPAVSKDDITAAADGNNNFALRSLATMGGNANLVFSPYSATQAMALLAAGAKGTTQSEIEQGLSFSKPTADYLPVLNALDLQLNAATNSADAPKFNLVNAIWSQSGLNLQQPYLDALAVNLGAGVHTVDFVHSSATARTDINNWVADQTNQRIKDLLPASAVTSDTRLVLTNAIWFKGNWLVPFGIYEPTRDQAFHAPGGDVSVPFMHRTDYLSYNQGNGYQAIELPYWGNNFSMVLVLPSDPNFLSTLSAAGLRQITGNFVPQNISLGLPKFQFETNIALASTLNTLGVKTAFDPTKADLSGIDGARDLSVSGVVQKAFIAVDERGTEAAAASGVVAGVTSITVGSPPVPLNFDRPFLFAIRDRQSGLLLFIGKVNNPAQN